MIVTFFLAQCGVAKESGYLFMARMMVNSVRRNMPGVQIIQQSDYETPMVRGVDEVSRLPIHGPLMLNRVARLAEFEGDLLLLDPDLIVDDDLRPVFNEPFDIALTNRYRRITIGAEDVTDAQPYLGGVCFSRTPQFWRDCAEDMKTMSERHQEWQGAQIALKNVAESGRYKLLSLPGEIYNWSPDEVGEPTEGRKVIHFKGKRKQWMLTGLFPVVRKYAYD